MLAYVTYSFAVRIYAALKSADRLTSSVNRLHDLEIKNTELKKQLKIVASPEFIEKIARDKLGLSKEDETTVIIDQEKLKQIIRSQKEAIVEQKLPNYLGWWRLFFK